MCWLFFLGGLLASTPSKGAPGPQKGRGTEFSPADLIPGPGKPPWPPLEVPASFGLSRSRSASRLCASHGGFPAASFQIQHLKWAIFFLRLGVGPLRCFVS